MNPRALVLIADGSEEIEAVTVIDVLRRATIDVTVAGLHPGAVRASRGVVLVPDITLDELLARTVDATPLFDAVVVPGGAPGAKAMREDERVLALLRNHAAAGKLVAAICAAPIVLLRAGLLHGRRVTSHPAVRDELRAAGVAVDAGERVVCDGDVLTSQAPGTAFEFAYAIVTRLRSSALVAEIEAGILSRPALS